jgi:DNA topoisomerase-6 subunit B
MSPPTDCLVPIGEKNLELGLKKEINGEFYATSKRPAYVYRGNPFVIETGIVYSKDLKQDSEITILRFANRVPLLYQKGSCAVTKAIKETNWKSYGLEQSRGNLPRGPLVILVHVSSVWVPFTSEAKEAIAHYDEIIKEVKLALQECGRKLNKYIRAKRSVSQEIKKREFIKKFIPYLSESLVEILKLSDKEKSLLDQNLKLILEKTRGELREIAEKNEHYEKSEVDILDYGEDYSDEDEE